MKQENNAGTGSLHKAGTIIGAVLCVILSVMLIGNLTIIVKGTVNPNTPPSMFGIYPLAVMSGSMSGDAPDHIEVGDLIFTKGVKPEEVKVNDVISFLEDKSVVTHRVMEIRTNEDGTLSYITKGDANNSNDSFPIPARKLLGVYKGRIPKVGDFALFLQQPLGMLIFIGIPLFAFIIYDIIRRQRLSRKENKKNNEMEAELERLRKLAGEDKSPNSSENDEANA